MTLFSHVFLIEREVLTLLILGFGCLHETSLGLQNIYLVASYLAIKVFILRPFLLSVVVGSY